MRSEFLTGASLEVMQEAWQSEAPLTAAQLLAAVNATRTKANAKHISHTGVAKALEQLQQSGFLLRDKSGPGFNVFRVVMSREQYVASAIQRLSQSVLRKNLADIFPALFGSLVRIATGPEAADAPLLGDAAIDDEGKGKLHNLGSADEIETLARRIANPDGSHLKKN